MGVLAVAFFMSIFAMSPACVGGHINDQVLNGEIECRLCIDASLAYWVDGLVAQTEGRVLGFLAKNGNDPCVRSTVYAQIERVFFEASAVLWSSQFWRSNQVWP